jgi:hypothetical protein
MGDLMVSWDAERFYPAPPDRVLECLDAAAIRLRFWSVDWALGKTPITFVTPGSMFSLGAYLESRVEPSGAGSIVRIHGRSRGRINVTAKRPESRNTERLLDLTEQVLREPPPPDRDEDDDLDEDDPDVIQEL